MLGAAFLWYSLVAEALRTIDSYTQPRSLADCKAIVTCEKIAQSISSRSQVLYPGEPCLVGFRCVFIDPGFLDSTQFNFYISHRVDSSSQVPVCSVEPVTSDDVATIVNSVFLPIHLVSH